MDHSKYFVDPIIKAYAQNIERLWRELNRINKKYERISRIDVNSHLAEFVWRHNEITKEKDPFFVAIELIAKTVFFSNINDDQSEEETEYIDFINDE